MGSAQLTGRVIFKGDPGYTEAVKNWNPYVDVCPLVFVFAQNSYDVSNAIKWAREKNVPLRVRSGRHALDKNLSTVSDGIVIDVSDMNNVFLDEKNAVATVQTGIHVGPLVKGLAREGFMAPFGDSPTVGIGGITMGGGFGVLSRSIGLISDNLLALKMVDAKGRIIQANHSRNEDLLWASRGGGGGNFGYNTQYTFKVHRAPKTATVFNIIWPWEQLETVFKAWQKWAPFTAGTDLDDLQTGLKLALWDRKDIAHESNVTITAPAHDTFWGGYAGHFQDSDGHLWEIVWNPHWEYK